MKNGLVKHTTARKRWKFKFFFGTSIGFRNVKSERWIYGVSLSILIEDAFKMLRKTFVRDVSDKEDAGAFNINVSISTKKRDKNPFTIVEMTWPQNQVLTSIIFINSTIYFLLLKMSCQKWILLNFRNMNWTLGSSSSS